MGILRNPLFCYHPITDLSVCVYFAPWLDWKLIGAGKGLFPCLFIAHSNYPIQILRGYFYINFLSFLILVLNDYVLQIRVVLGSLRSC